MPDNLPAVIDTVTISFEATPEESEKLQRDATSRGITVAAYVRQQLYGVKGRIPGVTPPPVTTPVVRGTRLPQGWVPPMDVIEQMKTEFPTVTRQEWITENRKFNDYWHAQPGAKATKIDWNGTWRNWMRKAFERRHPAEGGSTLSTVDSKAASYLD